MRTIVLLSLLWTATAMAADADLVRFEGKSSASFKLNVYGDDASSVTNSRFGSLFLRATPAVFEEISTSDQPGGPEIDAHTRLRVWSRPQGKPRHEEPPLYTIDVDCDRGRFIDDAISPDFYEVSCGENPDYRWRRLYRASDGTFVGEADYDPAVLHHSGANNEDLWVFLRRMGHPARTAQPPYPVALLTYMTRDRVLDRVILTQMDLHDAVSLSTGDCWHRLDFGMAGHLSLPKAAFSGIEFSQLRLVHTIVTEPSRQLLIPLTQKRLEIERAELPAGFGLIRVPPTGDVGNGLTTPAERQPR